jgi:hypothetical protein
MGTDLHLLVEVSHDGKPWKPLLNIATAMKAPRNYEIFSILADVRNGAGRHEPVWMEPREVPHPEKHGEMIAVPGFWYDVEDGGHERLVPISTPRGIPDDATVEWRASVLMWTARSELVDVSWVTPEEVLSADWDQVVIRHAVVPEEQYKKFVEEGKSPTQYGDRQTFSDDFLIVSEAEYREGKRGEHATAVEFSWSEGPVRNAAQSFLEMMEEMADITRKSEGSSKVRFMLLFES